MWSKALVRGVILSLPVLLLGWWASQVTRGAVQAGAERQRDLLARAVEARVATEQAALARELQQLCRFDRRAAQLAVQIEAGLGRGDADRSLQAMAQTLDLDALELRDARGTPLASSLGTGANAPLAAGLRDDTWTVRSECAPAGARSRLVAARAIALGPFPQDVEATAVDRGQVPVGESFAPARLGEDGPARLWLRVAAPGRPVAAAQAGTAVAVVLAFGLALLASRRSGSGGAETTALSALEQAAERVAQGDLVSHIGVRTGTEVDRTLTAFDRMTAELRATREKLVKAERAAAWQDMARRIAHEIKNPLSPIQTAMETLRKAHERAHPDFDEIFEESSLAILEEVRRLSRIVREFSEFARLPRPEPGAIDLAETVAHAVTLARQSGVPIALEVAPGLPTARADREQLTQVLLNLLQNACSAASEARGESARVEVDLEPTDAGARIAVHDNGPGIPVERRAQVFEPYYTESKQGSGLGLTIAARIVEEHGSKLELGDSPLGGACFTFELPRDESVTTTHR